jgi:hypothetical protein
MTDLLSRAELVRYLRTEEYADEIADIISNFPPAEGIDGAAQSPTRHLQCERCGEVAIASGTLCDDCAELSIEDAQPPAAPVERSAPAAPTGDTRSGERPPASAAMGHSAGADTRCSAGTDAAVEELAEFLCDEYEGEIGSFCSFNIETKDRWRDLVRAMLARIPAQPQTPKEPELLERASNAIGALLQWTSNWTVPFEGEDEWLGDKDVALRVRDEIGSVLSRPHGATPSVPAASAPAQRHRE